MELKEMLRELCEATGLSGWELGASEVAEKYLRAYTQEVRRDIMGSLIGHIPGKGRKILLDAHMDEIGMVVTAVDEHGFIKVAKSGGVDLRMLLGSEVTVWTESGPLYGVFCCRPPHLIASAADYTKAPELQELAVDIGYSAQRAKELAVPGDKVTFRRNFHELMEGKVTCKSLDDRAGVASILYCLDLLKDKQYDCDITALFSVQEEVGTRGAGPGAFGVMPQEAIAVDVSFAMTPDSPRYKCGDLGKGPMIGVSPVLSRRISGDFQKLAKENKIPYQMEIMGGETGTNADVISITGAGAETGLLSIPLRYMHSPVEVAVLEDIENTGRLIAQYILSIGGAPRD